MTTLALRKPHADRGMEGMVAKWYASNTAEMLKEYVDLARRISCASAVNAQRRSLSKGPRDPDENVFVAFATQFRTRAEPRGRCY
jgi:hypothetical protein